MQYSFVLFVLGSFNGHDVAQYIERDELFELWIFHYRPGRYIDYEISELFAIGQELKTLPVDDNYYLSLFIA